MPIALAVTFAFFVTTVHTTAYTPSPEACRIARVLDVALANVGVGQAVIDSQIALRATAYRNWEFTTISSPVDSMMHCLLASVALPSLLAVKRVPR